MIFGKMDRNYHTKVYYRQHGTTFPGGVGVTECAHIIPQLINRSIRAPGKEDKVYEVSSFAHRMLIL